MSGLVHSISTSLFNIIGAARLGERKRIPANVEVAPWKAVALRRDYIGKDIDEYRAAWGKAEGEAKFFHDNFEDKRLVVPSNLFMFNGASLLFQCSLGTGVTSANTGFPTPTFITNGNAYLYVSDGGPTQISGTVSINNGSATLTTTANPPTSLAVGLNLVITSDSSSQVYSVVSGSGTSWTISPVFGGTNVSGVTAGVITPPSHSQTALQGSTNVANQVCDAGFPNNPSTGASSTFGAITGASNLTPVVLTFSGVTIATNDIVSVVEVLGNTGANGCYVANPGGTTTCTLLGSVGNGSYTSGGLITEKNVLTAQSTFGSNSAVFQWNEWGLFNGNGSSKIMMNRRSVGLGSKANGTSSALKIGIAIS